MVLHRDGNIDGVRRADTNAANQPLVARSICGDARSCDAREFIQVPALRQIFFRSGDRHEVNRTNMRVLWPLAPSPFVIDPKRIKPSAHE